VAVRARVVLDQIAERRRDFAGAAEQGVLATDIGGALDEAVQFAELRRHVVVELVALVVGERGLARRVRLSVAIWYLSRRMKLSYSAEATPARKVSTAVA
jgi:hypothetical protein